MFRSTSYLHVTNNHSTRSKIIIISYAFRYTGVSPCHEINEPALEGEDVECGRNLKTQLKQLAVNVILKPHAFLHEANLLASALILRTILSDPASNVSKLFLKFSKLSIAITTQTTLLCCDKEKFQAAL